ncbi:MAG: serine hydroxymethyltransferase, partial [Epsilonproteobacteria bacterium]|nr:serine hydroxymethyltransferase [Campylobacterota bacterium]
MSYEIEKFDPEIFDAINQELKRQTEHLEMIASENFTIP